MKKRICLILACLIILSLSATVIADNAKTTAELAASISLPAALIKGDTYELPVPETDAGAMSVTVNGEGYNGSFVADGAQVTVAYATADGTAVGEYTLPVVDTNGYLDQNKYFYDAAGSIAAVKNENDVELSFSKDGQTSFIKELSSQDVPVYLSFVEGKSNFKTVAVKLTDAADARVSVTFQVNPAEKTVSFGSTSVQLEQLEEVLKLRYKNSSAKLFLDEQELLTFDKDDNGEPFIGFAGGVYLSVGFEEVSGSSTVCVTRVSNQALGHKNNTKADMTEPSLAITSPLMTTQYMGEEFNIPAYEIYDVLSPVAESSVTVEAPDGKTYTEPFTISQYGKYKLTFRAVDGFGNTMKTVKMIFVNDDIAPELTVAAMEKTTYKKGDAVTVPGYTVSDNLDAAMVDVILLLPNYEIRVLTHDAAGEITYCLSDATMYSGSFIRDNSSFIAEQTGTYIIRYVAYDDQYNRTVQELTFNVE